MKNSTKIKKIIPKFEDRYGEVGGYLSHRNVFELLCAVCLSAQCTDERVNMVTPALFKKYPNAEKMAKAKQADMEKLIKSCGFYKNKSKNLIRMAEQLMSAHGGEVPNDMNALVKLAGVGRKTANVVLGQWFNNSAGVVVDTHVKRICRLLGVTDKEEPEKIEQDLNEIVPRKHWDVFSLWLIAHGRETCIARRPQCTKCMINKYCDYYLS